MRLVGIDCEKFKSCYPLAYEALQDVCEEVKGNDPEMFKDDPWTIEGFKYYILEPDDGTVIAERKQTPGPREPGLIWSGGIVDDPHEGRWFCSEDADGNEECKLGELLNELAPGGIGGW